MPSRYTDQTLLRSSHFGDLYQANDSESGSGVVLRRLFDAETAVIEPERVSTLESRTARLTRLRHPNVAAILDGGADTYGGYVVSEWIDGNDLTSIVSQAALTPEDFATVARHTLDGLVAIHEHKLIHGSLRPSRIVVNWDEAQNLRFVITDLGLAELLERADIVTTDDAGKYNGVLDAMAPELFEGQPGDAQSDLYSLGNIFYYALTQSLPFAADTTDATIDRHHSGDVVHLSEIRQDVPAALADWVMSLISRNPEDRPRTAAVARDSLERAIRDEEPVEPAAADPLDPPEEIDSVAEAEPAPEEAVTAATAKVTVSAVPSIVANDLEEEGPAKNAARKPARKGGGWIPATVGGLLAIGLGAFAWFKFIAPSDDDESSTGAGTSAGTTATPAPLPETNTSNSGSAATKQAESTTDVPITEGLLVRFAFDEIAAGPGTSLADEWPKQEGITGIGSLQAQGVDSTTGSQVRKIVATPTMFPALNSAHTLLQVTGQASVAAEWQRDSEGFLTGDQLTFVVIFWTPEKDADLFRMHPPIASEAEISARITSKELVSNITYNGREFPIIPFPHGNQLIAQTLTWTGPQDSVMQSVMTANGERYNSKLAPAPNLSLLISSLTVGGNTGKLTENRPSGIYIAELLLYDRALSERERVLVDNYLNRKYFR